ncbi:MAG: hypothetical protein IT289_11365 [Oligoflexia bacterium]|nr:hypothetical protein [Oligoflexia bacterium]
MVKKNSIKSQARTRATTSSKKLSKPKYYFGGLKKKKIILPVYASPTGGT